MPLQGNACGLAGSQLEGVLFAAEVAIDGVDVFRGRAVLGAALAQTRR